MFNRVNVPLAPAFAAEQIPLPMTVLLLPTLSLMAPLLAPLIAMAESFVSRTEIDVWVPEEFSATYAEALSKSNIRLLGGRNIPGASFHYDIVHLMGGVRRNGDPHVSWGGRWRRPGSIRDALVARRTRVFVLDVDENMLATAQLVAEIIAGSAGPASLAFAGARDRSDYVEGLYAGLLGGRSIDQAAEPETKLSQTVSAVLVAHSASATTPIESYWVEGQTRIRPGLDFGREVGFEESRGPFVSAATDSSEFRRDRIVADLQPAGRILNAAFSEPDSDKRLTPNDALVASHDYDLGVQIGPRWLDSIVVGSRRFPDYLLPPSDSGYQLDVTLVSDDFLPAISTGRLHLPTYGASSPMSAERIQYPGPLLLRLQAPSVADPLESMTAHGRLLIYFQNNLLQSAAVEAAVVGSKVVSARELSRITVDYQLTDDYIGIAERFAERVVSQDPELQLQTGSTVRVAVTHNDDGQGHRIVIRSPGGELETGVIPYQPEQAAQRLKQAREATLACDVSLDNQNAKDTISFRKDLRRMADLGSQLYLEVLGQLDNNMARSVNDSLVPPSLIQISHAGRAPYPYPWAVVYDYVLDSDDSKWRFCPVLNDYWAASRNLINPTVCPYSNSDFHRRNVICPFGFWGLRHIIEEPLFSRQLANPLQLGSRVNLGIASLDDPGYLETVREHVRNLSGIGGIHFTPVDQAHTPAAVFGMLQEAGLAYFLCHNRTDGSASWLEIESAHPPGISNIELVRWGLDPNWDDRAFRQRQPIVFLNACESTRMTPGQTISWVSDFMRLGTSAVLGTEIAVRLQVAAEFAEHFFSSLLAAPKVRVGEALRDARWKLVMKGNLMGLGYTLYGLADIWIA